MKLFKNIIFYVIYLVCILAFIAAGLEYYYRYNESHAVNAYAGLYVQDQYLNYAVTPNLEKLEVYSTGGDTFHVSSGPDGLRGKPIEVERVPNTIRIMGMGGSHSFGWSIEGNETWSMQLGHLLKENPIFPWEVEVINASQPGADPNKCLLTYMSKGRKYKPDILILEAQSQGTYPLSGFSFLMKGLATAESVDEIQNLELTPDEWLKPDPDFREKQSIYIDRDGIMKVDFTTNPFWRKWGRKSALVRNMQHLVRTNKFLNSFKVKTVQNTSSDAEAQLEKYWSDLKNQVDETLNPVFLLHEILKRDNCLLFMVVRSNSFSSRIHPRKKS